MISVFVAVSAAAGNCECAQVVIFVEPGRNRGSRPQRVVRSLSRSLSTGRMAHRRQHLSAGPGMYVALDGGCCAVAVMHHQQRCTMVNQPADGAVSMLPLVKPSAGCSAATSSSPLNLLGITSMLKPCGQVPCHGIAKDSTAVRPASIVKSLFFPTRRDRCRPGAHYGRRSVRPANAFTKIVPLSRNITGARCVIHALVFETTPTPKVRTFKGREAGAPATNCQGAHDRLPTLQYWTAVPQSASPDVTQPGFRTRGSSRAWTRRRLYGAQRGGRRP